MAQLRCELTWYSSGGHLQQLFTGFLMLHRRGLIRLSQRSSRQPLRTSPLPHLRDVGGAHLGVVLDGELRLHYDCHDAAELNEDRLDNCDVYFKRSYSRRCAEGLARHRAKVLPLGLYYRVLPDVPHLLSMQRALITGRGAGEKLALLLDAVDAGNWLRYNPRVRDLEALPEPQLAPKVLFLAAAHDPYKSPGRSREKIDEMLAINDTRASCIRVLRKELGARFLGGFIHGPYSLKAHKDVLVEDNRVTRKRNYVRLLKSFPICIATTGLHGSIGGKFAEYVALAKAVVSEKLNYEVPGDLQAGRNYLEFASAQECARQSMRLVEDRDERARMMFSNARYYQSYLRADALVLNSLLAALAARAGGARRVAPAIALHDAAAA
jgi:hypothetical protein